MGSKSRIKLTEAFESYLLEKKDLNHLSTLELTSLSGVNRVTFYRHFNDMLGFLKWYILKDFIFHHQDAVPFTFQDAFLKVFRHITTHRETLNVIFSSKYQHGLIAFVESEVYAYQMMNFNRLDEERVLSKEEVEAHAGFYASGITRNILRYISDPSTFNVDVVTYTSYQLRIVKEYIERAIARKKAKAYDGVMEKKV